MHCHATCVDFNGKGILLLGPSGSGKSDAALRLMDAGALLVADDQVILTRQGESLTASPPPQIQGMMEVRGLGLIHCSFKAQTHLSLAVDLTPNLEVPRMPQARYFEALDVRVPLLILNPFEASFTAKVKAALSDGFSFFA